MVMSKELVTWNGGVWEVQIDRGWVLLIRNADTDQLLWVDPLKVTRG